MTIAVLADANGKKELLAKGVPAGVELIWTDSVQSLIMTDADAWFDLLFENDPERTAQLKKMDRRPVFINSVAYTTRQTGGNFIRINAWPGFLARPLTELVLPASITEEEVQKVFSGLNWKYQLVPDVPGMITPRVIAAIINEAYYTFGADVSSKEEIDTAMRLGTNYPKGPFEWSREIGLDKIAGLLTILAENDPRYAVAPSLQLEIIPPPTH